MIKYRPHKGSLADSLAKKQEFNTINEMKAHIVKDWKGLIEYKDITIDKDIIEDDRIGWQTQYVCTKKMGDEKFKTPQCIGMCDLSEYDVKMLVEYCKKHRDEIREINLLADKASLWKEVAESHRNGDEKEVSRILKEYSSGFDDVEVSRIISKIKNFIDVHDLW